MAAKVPTTQFWAIKHHPSGGFLPRPGASDHAWISTTSQEPSLTLPPRLYERRGDAVKAVEWWLMGVLERRAQGKKVQDTDVNIAGVWFEVKPVPSRQSKDVSVVPMRVVQDFSDWKNRP